MQDGSYRGLAIGGLLSMAAALGVGRFVYTPILPLMIEDLGWTKSDAGLVASANFLGYLLGALAATWRQGGIAPRQVLLIALVGSGLSTAGMAITDRLLDFAVLRFLGGAASAYVIVVASVIVLDRLAAAGRGRLSSWHFAGVGAGIMVSALVVSGLVAGGAGWRLLWAACGLLVLAAGIAVALLIPADGETRASVAAPTRSVEQSAPAHRGLTLLIFAYGMFGFGYVITTTFLVTIVRLTPALHHLEAWIWVLFGFAAVPSVAFWTWLAGRTGPMRAFSLACLVEALGVVASVVWTTPAGLMASAVLVGGTFMGLTALGLMGARRLPGVHSQTAIGRMTASFAVGQIIGPAVAGYLFDLTGDFSVASSLAGLALLVAAGLAGLIGTRQT